MPSRGYHNGGVLPIGYKAKRVKDGANEKTRLEPDDDYAPIIQRIFQLCITGMGAKEIVKALTAKGSERFKANSGIRATFITSSKMRNIPVHLVWNRQNSSHGSHRPQSTQDTIHVENSHPPIVDREMFERVQDILRERSPQKVHPRTINSDYLLSGLLYCGKCGAALLGSAAKSSRFFYYACQNYIKRGKSVCDARLIRKEKLEAFVIEQLKAIS